MSVLERIDRKISNMSITASMRACQACPNGEICRGWLDSAPKRVERIPEFCPNALRFEQAKAAMGSDNAAT
jgi:hypothetical protein